MKMSRHCCLLLGLVFTGASAVAQGVTPAPVDPAAYVVAYVDVARSARQAMIDAPTAYRDASQLESGQVNIDVLEQVGRPGHFALVEEWSDQGAVEARAAAEHVQQFRDRMQPIRTRRLR